MTEPAAIAELLQAGLQRRADQPAILFEGRTYTYEALERRVSALAGHFANAGLAGERVGLMLQNSVDLVCCYLACFRVGAVAAAISDAYAAPELARAIDVAQPKWLIIAAECRHLLDALDGVASGLQRIVVAGGGHDELAALFEGPSANLPGCPSGEQPALIFFTSGSTGKPKGVVHTHRSALAILASTCEALDGVSAIDTILVCEPQVHPSGFIATFSVLLRGGAVVLLSRFDQDRYIAALRATPPSLIVTHIDILVKLLHAPDIRREDFASLRGVYTGGDVVPAAREQQFRAFAGLPIQVGWGMTEAIWLTICRDPGTERLGCIGRPVGGAQVRVVGADGKDVRDGEIGEFWVRGPMLMREYRGDPDATARAFVDGWFRTGDSGSRDAEGNYWFAARIKNLIVRNTAKITPGEVEAALLSHPDVQSAAVIGAPDVEEGEVPVAFVVREPGRAPTAEALTQFLKSRIARYKVPVRYYFLAALPLTKSGKIDHQALRPLLVS